MAQGKMKVKSTTIQRKAKHKNKKNLGPKKGGKRLIAPKKSQVIKEKSLQNTLQKSINHSIEQELAQKAGTSGLNVVKVAPSDTQDTKKGKTKTKK